MRGEGREDCFKQEKDQYTNERTEGFLASDDARLMGKREPGRNSRAFLGRHVLCFHWH